MKHAMFFKLILLYGLCIGCNAHAHGVVPVIRHDQHDSVYSSNVEKTYVQSSSNVALWTLVFIEVLGVWILHHYGTHTIEVSE